MRCITQGKEVHAQLFDTFSSKTSSKHAYVSLTLTQAPIPYTQSWLSTHAVTVVNSTVNLLDHVLELFLHFRVVSQQCRIIPSRTTLPGDSVSQGLQTLQRGAPCSELSGRDGEEVVVGGRAMELGWWHILLCWVDV